MVAPTLGNVCTFFIIDSKRGYPDTKNSVPMTEAESKNLPISAMENRNYFWSFV